MSHIRRFALPAILVATALIACGGGDRLSSPRFPELAAAPIPDTPSVGFLAAYMTATDEHGLYYALSTDGRHFTPLYAGRTILRPTLDDRLLRDPTLFRDRTGRYHLVATVSWTHRAVVMWDSYDLVSWSHERLIRTGPTQSTKAWAPDLIYDVQRDRYVLIYTADEGNWPTTAFYGMTTTDFDTFSAPTLLYRDPSAAVIDASIVAADGEYHLFFRSDGIYHATSSDVMGPYTIADRVSSSLLEGPFVFATGGSDWTMLLDNWQDNSGYTLLESPNLLHWTTLTNAAPQLYNSAVSFPAGARQGSVIRLSQAQIDTLRKVLDVHAHAR